VGVSGCFLGIALVESGFFTTLVRRGRSVLLFRHPVFEKTVVTISFGTPRILRRVSTHFPERNAGPLWGSGWEWVL
jgi:hypothetical protein